MNIFQKMARRGKDVAFRRSETEVLIRDMTNNEQWGPTGKDLRRISQLTYSPDTYDEIMGVLWERIEDSGKNWRHIYKALLVIDFLLKNGCDRVIRQVQYNQVIIKTLEYFTFIENDEDVGLSVRQRASKIIELLQNEKTLAEERERAFKNREKFGQTICLSGDRMICSGSRPPHQNYARDARTLYPGQYNQRSDSSRRTTMLNNSGRDEGMMPNASDYDHRFNSTGSSGGSRGAEREATRIANTRRQQSNDGQQDNRETNVLSGVQDIFTEISNTDMSQMGTTAYRGNSETAGDDGHLKFDFGLKNSEKNFDHENYENGTTFIGVDPLPSSFLQSSSILPPIDHEQTHGQQMGRFVGGPPQNQSSYQLRPSDAPLYSEFQSSASTTGEMPLFDSSNRAQQSNDGYNVTRGHPGVHLPAQQRQPHSVSSISTAYDPWKTNSVDLSFLNFNDKPSSENIPHGS